MRVESHAPAAWLLWTLATTSCAVPPTAEPAGITPTGIVRSRIQKLMATQRLPSVCAAVIKDGAIQLEECFGFASIEKKIRATPDTMYALASLTKPLTAIGLMTLVERKSVDLGRPANDYLGDAKLVAHVGDVTGATVRRLLLCTSGLPEHVNIFHNNERARRPPMEQSIRRYGFLVTAPGEVYTYSNFGYGILEHIIERVSGQDYAGFMKARVFDPLDMSRTAILTEAPADGNAAVKYDDFRLPMPMNDYDHRGASAAYGSVRDLVKLARFMTRRRAAAQKKVLEDKTIDEMLHTADPGVAASRLRLGWAVLEHEGFELIHGSGGMPGAASRLDIVPGAGLICALTANAATADLWEIAKGAFDGYLSGYAEKRQARKAETRPPARSFSPPAALHGIWSGVVRTHEGDVAIRMEVSAGGAVKFELAGRELPVFKVPTGLVDWKLSFEDGFFTAPFRGNLRTSDTARSPHVLYAVLKLRDDRLTGYLLAAAVDLKFALPHWVELRKSE